MKTIVFTGGHHNSALSVAAKLQEDHGYNIIWYGHRYTMLGDNEDSAEYTEVTKHNIIFKDIKAGKVYKTFNPIHWIRLPYGMVQSFWNILMDRPKMVVSFGGYLAAPVVFSAWLLGIPVVTHEQTTVVGLSNRFISKFAKKIFITWPQSKRYFNSNKVVITGLPLRDVLFKESNLEYSFDNNKPTLYITGGKQGSHIINEVVSESLKELLSQVNIIHQCGSNTIFNDYDMLQEKVAKLPESLRKNYILKKYIFEEEIGSVFSIADFIISRAGAHTVYEVAALAKPTIFIPIPWVSHNEQYKNARLLANEGAALLLPENTLSKKTLLQHIHKIIDSLDTFKENAEKTKNLIVFDANERIIQEIEDILVDDDSSQSN